MIYLVLGWLPAGGRCVRSSTLVIKFGHWATNVDHHTLDKSRNNGRCFFGLQFYSGVCNFWFNQILYLQVSIETKFSICNTKKAFRWIPLVIHLSALVEGWKTSGDSILLMITQKHFRGLASVSLSSQKLWFSIKYIFLLITRIYEISKEIFYIHKVLL